MITLGCFRNEVESDLVRSVLSSIGMDEAASAETANVVLINTCGFIKGACEEGIDTILEVSDLLSDIDNAPPIVAMGCMGQRYGHRLMEQMPEVAAVLGTDWKSRIEGSLRAVLSGKKYCDVGRSSGVTPPVRTFDCSKTASLFIRISDGCNKKCSFCTIPCIRGKYASRSPEDICNEIERLSGGKDREVILLAQDLTAYGCDLPPGRDLVSLIKRISKISRARWMRLLYLQPEGVTEELLDEVIENPKVMDYFDIPFQHASERVLKRMGRTGNAGQYRNLLERIRQKSPEAAIRSTVMTGFPGETDEDFGQLLEFIENSRFDWLGAFVFSPEEGTRAADHEDRVPETTSLVRYGRILELQDGIEESRISDMIGRRLEVVIDGESDLEGYDVVGRSYREAPVVDGVIYLAEKSPGCREAKPGDFVVASIKGQEGLDLVGEI